MGDDVMRIQDLVSLGSLDLTVIAGADGIGNEVLWAHSCEMPHPERYLGPHELLMTSGYCVPTDAGEQVAFIRDIHEAGLSGIAVAAHDPTPPLSQSMLDEADRRGFPMLLAGVNVAYAMIARHIAAANTSSQTLQVLTLSKIYHEATYAEGDLSAMLVRLVPVLRAGLTVTDASSGVVLGEAGPLHPDQDMTMRRVSLDGAHGTVLTLHEFPNDPVDRFLLVHLTKLLQVAADGIVNDADRSAERSEHLLRSLLNGVVPAEVAGHFTSHPLTDGYCVAAFPMEELSRVARAAFLSGVSAIVSPGRTRGLALVPAAGLESFRAAVTGVASHVGVSSVFLDLVDTRPAAVEASRVLHDAEQSGTAWSEYTGSSLAVLTRSRQEAEEIVAGVLGGLADDSAKNAILRETLFCYLRNDRGWTATSEELLIHRQTLAYRLKKVSEALGRDLNRSADISALWIAAQAWESLHPRLA